MNRSGRKMRAGQARSATALVLAAILLAGCGDGGLAGGLRRAGVGAAPDEFLVLPTKPLEVPADLSALPPPTPGAVSRADPRPETDAVAALTGRPAPAGVGGAPGLVARAGPVDPNIRRTLAQEDATFRAENRGLLLERIAAKDSDYVTYGDVRLNAGAEFDRVRAGGLRVPAAPPPIE